MRLRQLFSAVALLWGACQVRPDTDPAILRLGSETVRVSEYDRHIETLARRGHEVNDSLREALLEPFLEERVLVLEARRRGLMENATTPEAERVAVEGLLARALPQSTVTDEEIRSFFEGQPERFQRPATVKLSQILVPTENEARDVRRRLQRDPKSFEILARSRSRSPEASAGGLMGVFEAGQLPVELEQAAFALPTGGTSDVVASPLGFHVLRVDARTEPYQEALEASAERIRTELTRQKRDQAVRAYVQKLLAEAEVNHEIARKVARTP
jgi:parvulin-like peptidyl-prolyl isomerase